MLTDEQWMGQMGNERKERCLLIVSRGEKKGVYVRYVGVVDGP